MLLIRSSRLRLVLPNGSSNWGTPLPFLEPRCPQSGARSRREQEEERQYRHQLQHHGHGAEPSVLPHPSRNFVLAFLLGQATQGEPSVVRKGPQPRACDDDESGCADKGDQVERQEDNQLDDLYQTPRLVDCRRTGLSQHLDRVRGVGEQDTVGRDEVREALVNEGCLQVAQLVLNSQQTANKDQTSDSRKQGTYIKNIHAAFVHEEPFEQPLDDHQTFAQCEHHGVKPRGATVEDGEERELRQEGEGE